jgi:DNA-binding MarR family transcriptional regulator
VLEPLLGSTNAERVLIFILVRKEGYIREIARFFGCDPDSIQKQLAKFEGGGVLVSSPAFYVIHQELIILLTAAA